ncbi:dermonecrotic toxin domain-containing protein [Pseudomonas sp. NA-150]|uniref:dermonecrotic toxin domain-containing protein n=1 Tax=Pseudomonas sp. NA-150 TaxID=3367525 RepID=UPI0037CC3847
MSSAIIQAPKSDQQQLRERARQFVVDYPDLHNLAHAAAEKIIRQHTRLNLNPQKVFWHRFATANSSPRTFTGWQHSSKPVESMTLIELLMHRFNAHDQLASDELSLYGGFYTDGPDHQFFDETNEVPMLPQDVLRDFWALDFSAAYTRTLECFWAAHNENFYVLAKARFLAAAGECLRRGQLLSADFERVSAVVTNRPRAVPALSALLGPTPATRNLSVHTLDVGGVRAHDILRIVSSDGQQVLYIPDAQQPFRAFDSEQVLYDWVKGQFLGATTRPTLIGHFLRSSVELSEYGPAFERDVGRLIARDWSVERHLLNQHREPISGDAFVYLRDIARQKMADDATQLLTSNTDLRKQMWIGYLSAFIQVFGGMAPLGWPIALTLVGASLVNTGLNIDQAINGKTAAQRQAGVLGAILNAIYLFCNLPLLASMRPVTKCTTVIEGGVVLSGIEARQSASELIELAEPLDALTPSTDGRYRGVFRLENGQTWIKLDNLPQPVLFNEGLQSWVIIDPQNPFAFYGLRPVQLNAQGQWTQALPLGLSGGAPMDALPEASGSTPRPYSSVKSEFWDRFMLQHLSEEQRYSAQALERQQQIINILELDGSDVVGYDSDGNKAHLDQWGALHRVFKNGEGTYVGDVVQFYTEEEAPFNTFLRTGVRQSEMVVRDLRRLIDDLDVVGYNNDVELYRGGSGKRNTSGEVFRSGRIRVGDVLVNTDIASFTESPYMARAFASSQAGSSAADISAPITFDDTSVVFVLPKESYLSATPIAPFSETPEEAESLFLPGHYFHIDSIEEVTGEAYRFMKVQMREVGGPIPGRGLYDLRTGELFSRAQYAAMLGLDAQALVDRFFPLIG